MKALVVSGLICLGFVAGCEQNPASETDSSSPSAEQTAEKVEKPAEEEPVNEDDIPMEVDPAATASVELVDFKGKAPDGFATEGDLQAVLGWTDKYGTNAVVIARKDVKDDSLLVVKHATQEGDGSWSETRTFKELVKNCEWDTTLASQVGEWSVTDLDKNGLGEATFAYSAGCRSDVSPVSHKVIITENGNKFVLRGSTKVDPGGGTMGGEFAVDEAFASAPKGFEAHVKKVWRATVVEN